MLAKDLIKILEVNPDMEVRLTAPNNSLIAYEIGMIKRTEVHRVKGHPEDSVSAIILEGSNSEPDNFWEQLEWMDRFLKSW